MKEQYSQSNVHVGDTLICAATAAMVIPSTGAHLRKVEFRFPRFTNKPTVTATIHSDETTENVFSVLAIKINDRRDRVDGEISQQEFKAKRGVASDDDKMNQILVIFIVRL